MTQPISQTTPVLKQTPDGTKSRAWILPFSILLLVISVDSIDVNSFGPVMAQIKSAWKMNNTHVGIYTGMYGLLSILVAVPIGEAVRRWGVKRAVCETQIVTWSVRPCVTHRRLREETYKNANN